jgi:hypothetical protein
MLPTPKTTVAPMRGSVTAETLAVPMRFEHNNTATNPARTRS